MRLMIIEDDPSTAEIIRDSINWPLIGICAVETAHNIVAAKQLFSKARADIAICDIEMPLGSGLELLRWARESGYASEFIFLTNHESFGFATAALQYQALSYLLKPFDAERLTREVIKAMEKIQREKTLAEYSQYGGYWIENKSVVEQRFWCDMLFGHIAPERNAIRAETEKRGIAIDCDGEIRLVLLSALWREDAIARWGSANKGILEYGLAQLCAEILLGDKTASRCVSYTKNEHIHVALIAFAALTRQRCEALLAACLEQFGYETTLYLDDPRPLNGVGAALIELEEVDRNNIRNRGTVQTSEQFAVKRDEALIDVSGLAEMLAGWEKIRILNEMKRRMDLLAAANKLGNKSMRALQQNVIQAVYVHLNANGISPDTLYDSPAAQQLTLGAVRSLYDMVKWQSYFIGRALDYVKELQTGQPIIERARQFVAAHYMEDISRNEVAAHVFLTSEYFAKLFKKETGMCIKEYINGQRIQHAKLLLSGNELSVSDVALKVGFDNISYFSTVFKKQTGLAPNEYRAANKCPREP